MSLAIPIRERAGSDEPARRRIDMSRAFRCHLVLVRAALALGFLLFVAPTAWAIAPPECPTWFPDFGDCDRHGRYEGFGHTYSMPFLFEDPFITTDIRAWGMWNDLPNGSIFGGGDVWAGAVQARIAITDRLAFIATKDGYAKIDPANTAVFNQSDGFLNITGGFKYAVIDMRDDNFILTPSVRIEIPVGQDQVFQGYGDGVIIPAISTAYGIGDVHAIADFGAQIPFDMDKQSSSLFYNLHLEYHVLPFLIPLIEVSGIHYVDSGKGTLIAKDSKLVPDPSLAAAQAALMTGGFDGVDLLNLGSPNIGGNDIVTFAVGLEVPITKHVSLGAIYEFPLTKREDLIDERVTLSLNLEF
jgi:hypothetical protein